MPQKRQGSPYYWYDFTIQGNRFRGSLETSDFQAARTIEAKLRHDALLGQHIKRRPRMTLNDALGRYWQEHAKHLRSGPGAVWFYSAHVLRHFGQTICLDEMDDAAISAYKASQIGEKVGKGKKARDIAPATINRRLAFLRAVMTKARKEWGIDVPEIDIRKHKLREPEARTRWITPEEADKLIAVAKPWLKGPIKFALLTGARLSNIMNLRWEDVNLQRRMIRLKGVKSSLPGGKTLELPISDALHALLKEQGPAPNGMVFVRRFTGKRGKPPKTPSAPIAKFRRSFKTACKDAGITNFRFHDLRHTAASWMIQNGVPLDVVQQVLGHSNISMTQKYAHRDIREKKDALQTLAATQIRHKNVNKKQA